MSLRKRTSKKVKKVKVGSIVSGKVKEFNEWKMCKILEIGGSHRNRKYYVHFPEFDRRMDRWLESDEVDLKSLEKRNKRVSLTGKKLTRSIKKKYEEINLASSDVSQEIQDEEEKEHQEATKIKEVEVIRIGKYEIDTWYYSPYSKVIIKGSKKLFLCEFCLKYFCSLQTMKNHYQKCKMFHPPGDEIYRDEKEHLSFWEVNGQKNRFYCQNLTLLSKLFLDHKSLYYDVDPFVFFVLTENDEEGCHIVGYFSKEKNTKHAYNLSCILVLPPYQRKGYGKYLIDFSYNLSSIEKFPGTPEKPLSDLGYLGYLSYWKVRLIECLRKNNTRQLSIQDISELTFMTIDDILTTMKELDIMKHVKGGSYTISVPKKVMQDHYQRLKKIKLTVDRDKIHWTPYNYDFKAADS